MTKPITFNQIFAKAIEMTSNAPTKPIRTYQTIKRITEEINSRPVEFETVETNKAYRYEDELMTVRIDRIDFPYIPANSFVREIYTFGVRLKVHEREFTGLLGIDPFLTGIKTKARQRIKSIHIEIAKMKNKKYQAEYTKKQQEYIEALLEYKKLQPKAIKLPKAITYSYKLGDKKE